MIARGALYIVENFLEAPCVAGSFLLSRSPKRWQTPLG